MTTLSITLIADGANIAAAVLEAAKASNPADAAIPSALVEQARSFIDRVRKAQDETTGNLAVVQTARNEYASDEIEIDDTPLLSVADEGIWVSAWLWVPYGNSADDVESGSASLPSEASIH